MRLLPILSLGLTCVSFYAGAQDETMRHLSPPMRVEGDGVQKPEARPETEIKKQTDLDTFQLASAHREQAESMRERTNGLWQSWLVSVCEGCGPERRPFFKRRTQVSQKTPEKVAPGPTARQPVQKAVGPKVVATRVVSSRKVASIYEDLSDSRIDQIRRAPAQ